MPNHWFEFQFTTLRKAFHATLGKAIQGHIANGTFYTFKPRKQNSLNKQILSFLSWHPCQQMPLKMTPSQRWRDCGPRRLRGYFGVKQEVRTRLLTCQFPHCQDLLLFISTYTIMSTPSARMWGLLYFVVVFLGGGVGRLSWKWLLILEMAFNTFPYCAWNRNLQ